MVEYRYLKLNYWLKYKGIRLNAVTAPATVNADEGFFKPLKFWGR